MSTVLIFELLHYLIFCIAVPMIIVKRAWPAMTVIIFSAITNLMGERLNAYITKVAVWSPEYLLWFPGGKIPVYVIVAGPLLSLLIYGISVLILHRLPWRLFLAIPVIALLGLTSPYIELFGLTMGLWRWQPPHHFDLQTSYWGVYDYYLKYVFFAAYLGWFPREFIIFWKKSKKK